MKPKTPFHWLRNQEIWSQAAWPLGILVIGLGGTLAACLARPLGPREWLVGVGLTLALTLVAWLLRMRSLRHNARRLDQRLAAKNRLETAAALRHDPGALAKAQREETSLFLEQAPTRSRLPWLVALGALVVLLMLAHMSYLAVWTLTTWQKEKPAANPDSPVPEALIAWKSPEAEAKAAPIEEVPVEAGASSTSGLRDMTLEIAVNGQARSTMPIDLMDLQKPGSHTIKASLFLDQLEVQPYDVVSYYLQAHRIDPRALPATVSPVQFVQVRPFREDVRELPGGGESSPGFSLLKALKVAQLRLVKENFLLTHADVDRTGEMWKKENDRVGGEQNLLQQKTAEVIEKFIADGMPAEIVNLLSQAQPLMQEAGEKISAAKNAEALPMQGKALALLTEVEKYFTKAIAEGGKSKGSTKDVKDPFEKQKELELKQRSETQAGELELLAAEQKRLAEDLANPTAEAPQETGSEKIDGTPVERQTQISQRVGALLNGAALPEEAVGHLEKARDRARESLRHLDDSQTPAAQEPAAEAARELRLAVDAMNKAGEKVARDRLAEALQELNKAAETAQTAPQKNSEAEARQAAEEAAAAARDVAEKMAEAAQKQQESGSERAAERLEKLAKDLSADDLQKLLNSFRKSPGDEKLAEATAGKLQELAQQAGRERNTRPLSAGELAQLADRLQRAQTNLARLADVAPETPQVGAASKEGDKEGSAGQEPKDTAPAGEGPGKGAGQGSASPASPPSQQSDAPGTGDSPGGSGPGKDKPSESAMGMSDGSNSRPADGITVRPLDFGPPPQGSQVDDSIGSSRNISLASREISRETREKFTREIVEDLREAASEANAAVPDSEVLKDVHQALYRVSDVSRHYADPASLYAKVNPPLEGLITLLRKEAHRARREHALADQETEPAPPAYRSAVADYFERLSRDFEDKDAAQP